MIVSKNYDVPKLDHTKAVASENNKIKLQYRKLHHIPKEK
jgi:hypothetical protein